MSGIRAAGAGALLLSLVACAKLAVVPVVGYEEMGAAVWDGHPPAGRRPASREVYDMSQLTAGHRTLPLGSSVMVESLLNGRTVEVRITDRGLGDRRILALSLAAARFLGAVGPAVLPVRLRVAGLPGSPPRLRSGAFTVEVAAFTSEYRAQVLKDILDRAWRGAHVQRSEAAEQTFYRVRVGMYSTLREARRVALRLAAAGYPVVVMEE
jgi:rare lipoprotein A